MKPSIRMMTISPSVESVDRSDGRERRCRGTSVVGRMLNVSVQLFCNLHEETDEFVGV
jgi:hypothetical protein